MAKEDLILGPESLEALLGSLGALEPVFGPAAKTGLPGVRAHLEHAIAHRRAGQPAAAIASISAAMDGLVELASVLGADEARMMRAVAAQFQNALGRGDTGTAAESVDRMRERSGAIPRKGD